MGIKTEGNPKSGEHIPTQEDLKHACRKREPSSSGVTLESIKALVNEVGDTTAEYVAFYANVKFIHSRVLELTPGKRNALGARAGDLNEYLKGIRHLAKLLKKVRVKGLRYGDPRLDGRTCELMSELESVFSNDLLTENAEKFLKNSFGTSSPVVDAIGFLMRRGPYLRNLPYAELVLELTETLNGFFNSLKLKRFDLTPDEAVYEAEFQALIKTGLDTYLRKKSRT